MTIPRFRPRYSAHLGYLFTELDYEARFQAAREAGFAAVEHPSPYHVPAERMAQMLARIGLPYVQFGLPNGDASKGEKGIAIFPDRRDEFRTSLRIGLDYAEAIGVRLVHAMAGILPAALRRPEHLECYIANLQLAADAAQDRGIGILVEPMSPAAVPDYFVATMAEGAGVLDAAAHPNIALLADVFHITATGENPAEAIRAHAGRIAHLHYADFPGRHEPGSGHIDFAAIARALHDTGYAGFIGCEYAPANGTVAGLGWREGGAG